MWKSPSRKLLAAAVLLVFATVVSLVPAVANAAPIPGGSITAVCTGTDNGSGTFTLTANCGDVTSLWVPITRF
jgi:hypothetical protein